MKRAVPITVALTIVLWACPGEAQDVIPRNPLFLSLTGTGAEQDLYREVSLSTFDLLTGSFQFEEDEESAKAVFAPFKLSSRYRPVLSEIAVNVAQAKGITTFGIGAAYNSRSAFSTSAVTDLQERLAKMPAFRGQMAGETDDAYDLVRETYLKNQWAEIYDVFYTKLAHHAWIVSAAYNAKTFEIVSDDALDADGDGRIDNAYTLKGWDLSGTFAYTFNQATGFTVAGHYGRRRESAVEGSALVPYPGWSFTFAQRVKVLNPDYKYSDDYLRSLFIPAILVGASLEWERCGGADDTCEDGQRSRRSFTPFIELRISPEAQFRIGIPVRRTVLFGGKGKTELSPALQYVLQLKGTK